MSEPPKLKRLTLNSTPLSKGEEERNARLLEERNARLLEERNARLH